MSHSTCVFDRAETLILPECPNLGNTFWMPPGDDQRWCNGNGQAVCLGEGSAMEGIIPNPYSINWDDNNGGSISDGGDDMYDGGNILSTTNCG